MEISRLNPEGYQDPVAYEALKNVETEGRAVVAAAPYLPLVYVCSPYAGDIEKNTENAKRYSRFAVDSGAIPVTPHLMYPQFMDERTERQLALKMGIVLLGKCEQVWVFGDRISAGMAFEIKKAEKMRKKIRYISRKEVSAGGY